MDHGDGALQILDTSRNYFAPGAVDAIRRQVVRFMRSRHMDQSINAYIVEFDRLRRRAESQMVMGADFPGQFIAIFRMDNAALSRQEKSSVMAIYHKRLRFEGALANIHRLSGSRGGGSRLDAPLREEAAESHASDEDLDALAAYRMAKKQGAGKEKKDGPPERG